jgi:putative ABC transport system substrate-binding protein
VVARAQQPGRVRRIGVLIGFSENDLEQRARNEAFLNRMQQLGWINGRNIQIEYRYTDGDATRARAHSNELAAMSLDLVLVQTNSAMVAMRQTAIKAPVVFVQVSDPVGGGFVANLARPGDNLTGFTNFEPEMGGKWLEVLQEIAPGVERVAVLHDPYIASHAAFLRATAEAAHRFGIIVTAADASDAAVTERSLTAFATAAKSGLIALPSPAVVNNRSNIIEFAARYRLPAIYPYRFFATAGGLVSYGIDQIEQWRLAASYVDRILRGEKPADLPVQQPTKYELAINLKTAKALGLTVPPKLLFTADEVIE